MLWINGGSTLNPMVTPLGAQNLSVQIYILLLLLFTIKEFSTIPPLSDPSFRSLTAGHGHVDLDVLDRLLACLLAPCLPGSQARGFYGKYKEHWYQKQPQTEVMRSQITTPVPSTGVVCRGQCQCVVRRPGAFLSGSQSEVKDWGRT